MEKRVLVCNMNALTAAQRERHAAMTKRLIERATRRDFDEGIEFSVDPRLLSAADLAEWVADESRCCPAVDFHLDLPASGPLTLRLDGGADVKVFIAAELGIEL
jgi:hypothetical protein